METAFGEVKCAYADGSRDKKKNHTGIAPMARSYDPIASVRNNPQARPNCSGMDGIMVAMTMT